MEFRKAYIEEAELICNVVQTTKKVIYPLYYTKEVVDFFGKLHFFKESIILEMGIS